MSFRSALSHAGFRRLWAAQSISRLGDSIHEIALIWIAYEVTGDPALMSVVVVASLLPLALTSLPAGVLVDRWDRKRVLVGTTFARGAAVLCIPVVGSRYPQYLVPTILVVAFVTGLLQAFSGPTKMAAVPSLVPDDDLDSANALTEMTKSVSRLFYALGGFLVAYFGSYFAFYADAASFFVAGALLLALPDSIRHTEKSGTEDVESTYAEMKTGLKFIWGHPVVLRLILLSVLTGLALGPLAVILPMFADTLPNGNGAAFGYLYGAVYFGSLVGGIAYNARATTARGRVIVGGVLGMGVALVSLVAIQRFSPRPTLVSLVSMSAFGVCLAGVQIPVKTLAQSLVPDRVQGRVFSVWTAAGLVATPVSVALAGIALTRLHLSELLLAQGGVTILVGGVLTATLAGQPTDQTLNTSTESANN